MAKHEKLVRNVFNLITNLVTRNNLNYRAVVKMGAKDKIKRGDSKKSTSKPSKYKKYVCQNVLQIQKINACLHIIIFL